MVNAISVDLEDWYHICDFDSNIIRKNWEEYQFRLQENVSKIMDLFKLYNIHATFFALGIIAENDPGLIKRIVDAGHEVATHGFSHRRIFDMTPEEFEEDLLKSKSVIERASGKTILGYRAPEWSLKKSNIWALDIMKKHGFCYDASVVPLTHLGGKYFSFPPHQIKTKYGNIIEFPLSTYRCLWERLPFSGGLPMRITPYWHILECTKMINHLGYPVMFYLHPWEFDSEHVKIDLPINRKFMHYYNLESTAKKIKLLLERLEFSTVEDVLHLRKASRHQHAFLIKYSKHYDVTYFKSLFLFLILFVTSYLALFIITALMKLYGLLLIIVILTIFYWPWGLLFNKINSLFRRS